MSAVSHALISALQADPGNWELRCALVESLMSEEKKDDAYAVLSEVTELPRDVDSVFHAARAYGAFEPSNGIDVLDGIISGDPTCARAYLEKAKLCIRMGDHESAQKQYEAAITFDPGLRDAELESMLGAPAAAQIPASSPEQTAVAHEEQQVAYQHPEAVSEEVYYPEPGQYPTITLAQSKQAAPEPVPLVDPALIPEHPHLAYQPDPDHQETLHTTQAQFLEQVHNVDVHTAYHPHAVSHDYQQPNPSIFEPTITDDEIYVGALVTETGEPVANLQQSVVRNRQLKEAENAQKEKAAKFHSLLAGLIVTGAVCLLMALVVSAVPRPNPPQIYASTAPVDSDEPLEKPMIQKTTPNPSQSASSMSMDLVTVDSASNLSMVSFDSPTIDLGSSNLGNDFGSSMNFGDGMGGGSVMFFGGKSTGKRFLFVLDASASMKPEQIKLRDDELEKTLKSLRNVEYHILLFASGGYYAEKGWGVDLKNKAGGRGHTHFFAPWGKYTFKELGGLHSYEMNDADKFKSPAWLKSDSATVRRTLRFVRESKKFIGTDWDNALKMGFKMNPPPDVIFFMSDGRDSKLDLNSIMSAGRKAGKPKINCVAMQTAQGAELFAGIAKKSRGAYTIVDKDGEPIDGFEYMKDPASFAGRLNF